MEGDILGVRIVPPVIQFFDTKPKTCFELPISVKNISNSSKSIRYYGPKSECFSLRVNNPDQPIAPGLAVSAVVVYESPLEREEKDRIVITVDGNVLEVPIFAFPSRPVLDYEGQVDFGIIVANNKVFAKNITVRNSGSKSGDFEFKYDGISPISIIPARGTVPPHSDAIIKVEYLAKNPGKFEEEADVYLEGRNPAKLEISGRITERALELLTLQGDNSKVDCIRFGNTYYGTDTIECALLYNNGPEPVSFVAILDETAIAQELGVDLTMSTTLALAKEIVNESKSGHTNTPTSLITAIPNQGILKPYQKIPIFFKFSPRWFASKQGWKNFVCPPPRKDFALFMKLQIVGSSSGFIQSPDSNKDAGSQLEVAITGTALPVLLNISPAAKFDFGECPVSEHADILCTIRNESKILPALFEFRRIAHFSAHPPNGKIFPGQTQDVIFSFAPKQVGTFKPEMFLDVIGQVVDPVNPTESRAQIIFSLPIKLLGQSDPITVVPKPKFNPGITPLITNEVGLNIETKFKDLNSNHLRMAIIGATKTKLHRLKNRPSKSAEYARDDNVKVAFPNDRARSIQPFDRKDRYKTLLTRAERHNFIDPDYAYDDLEIEKKRKHQAVYVKEIHKLGQKRAIKKRMKEFKQTNNNLDIGIKSAAGIFPKKLTQDEIQSQSESPVPSNAEWKLLSTKELAETERKVLAKPVCEGLNAIPITDAEKRECSRWLTPQQLHQIVIGPPTIDFGKVCVKSVCQKELNIVNNLNQNIHIVAEIDCKEFRQSSPLSQVVPPHSKAVVPIIFESHAKGKFQRSVLYTVNGFFKHHVTVQAEVVPVALELSTTKIVLKAHHGLPAEAGYRGVITLYNNLNYPAEFTWSPDLGENGTAFSIRPAIGVVDPGTDLDCEIVWHASYLAPEDGSFTLLVNGGESRSLICKAELGASNVYFLDQRVSFGSVPVNLTSIATGLLHNTGANHAYFQVCDPNPLPGLSISPVHGVVPVGGSTEIRVSLNPDSIIKFDTRIQICIKGGKTLELRIGGSVESPVVNIDVGSFNFGGVFCGSAAVMPFKMENKGEIKCRVEVDLTKYKDFLISFPGYQTQEDLNFQTMNAGMASVTIDPLETIEGEIIFTPTQVASYDFVLPLSVNYLKVQRVPPSPASTQSAKNSSRSITATQTATQTNSMHIINPKPTSPVVDVSSKHVIATAMRQPLQLSTKKLEFILPANFNDFTTHLRMDSTKPIVLVNTSNDTLTWGLDLGQPNKHLDAGIFKFLHDKGVPFISQSDSRGIEGDLEPGESKTLLVNFCPNDSGQYHVTIPVVINSDWNKPFQFLEIFGELKCSKLWFDPAKVIFTPVPLLTETSVEVTLLASNYRKKSQVTVTLPNIPCDDKTQISPLTVTFLNGDVIMPCDGSEAQVDPCAIPCRVTFMSPKPVSFQQPIVFSDEDGQSFSLQVTATADNCLLTCYPFLALHRGDHQIVCEQGTSPKGRKVLRGVESTSDTTTNSGEALLLPCTLTTQGNSRPSTSATSSNFQISSSSYESSSLIDTSATTTPGRREGAMNKPPTGSDFEVLHLALEKAVTAIFPDEDTEEGRFHLEVVTATQRWFASQGWPGGAYPILIPETLRTSISKKTASESLKTKDENQSKEQFRGNKKQKSKTSFNKLAKTIYDMVSYLSGRPVPGIPINSPLPSDPLQRVKQVYWQHCTLLTFLRCQGACVAHIQPEYLMAPTEFLLWRQLQKNIKLELLRLGNDKEAAKIQLEEDIEEALFEAISKRMWTDILLQILKVLVLSKVTPKTLKAMSSPYKDVTMPMVNPDPLASNIYSVSERILLAWMNHCYETYRASIWQDCSKGGVPPSRWIVNFDYDLMDGLVLAALLGAHMPFIVKSHLEGMYTHPVTAEQCLHNALKVISAMRFASIDFDIQAIDITDPNPINLLLLVVNLYQRLPSYLPKTTIEFVGTLHQPVVRQVKVTNTSVKSIVYNVILAGNDAADFVMQKGNLVTIPPKSTFAVNVEFKSRFLRNADAVLLLVGRRHGAATGNTLSFKLVTEIDNIRPKSVTKVESPCYELKKIMLEVTNPFPSAGDFRIVLIESNPIFHENSPSTIDKLKTSPKNVTKKTAEVGIDVIPMNWILEHQETSGQKNSQIPKLQAFSTSMSMVHIESNASAEVEIDYLPFSVEDRQCSVIFLDENIGEFLCSIEATALQPLPSYLPYVPNKNSARISSTAAAESGRGLFGGDSRVIYWRCEAGMTLKEILQIPVVNIAKERALIMASQQNMSDLELQRRQVTGTLMSCTVTSQTIKKLSNNPNAAVSIAKAIGPVADVYRVEVDSELFKVPNLLVMPSSDERKKCRALDATNSSVDKETEGFALLPVEFKAKEPGHYPATITLRAIDDIRVYRIECTVNREGSFAEFEFSAPVNHTVTQDIPIINPTDYDWPLTVTIMGDGFTGPKEILSKSFTTSFYTLTFRPMKEEIINGKLIMTNEEDGSEQTYQLTGIGLKPLALDFIKLICGAKSNITHSVNVPNVTKKKLVFRVESNLPFITGPTSVTVLPNQTNVYSFDVNPTKRGSYQGVLSFVARDNPDKEFDSDGEELSQDNNGKDYLGYRLWYAVEVEVKPPLPERVMKVSCACLRKTALDVIVRNPTSEQITLAATITGSDLSGPLSITLPPGEKDVYTLTFAPSHVGESTGSLIFFNEAVGEFWYDLQLKAEPPIPTTLPHMECELGKWTKQVITLKNPTNETLALSLSISNTNNFSVEWDSDKTVPLKQKASMDVVLRFMPTSLGDGEHLGRIIFHSEQLGDWVFIASGTGLLPRPQPPVCTYTLVGSNTTVIIPFRNPTDVSVLADILLTDNEQATDKLFDGMPGPVSAFKLLLKHCSGVHVGPKSTLEIPISFAPNEMINYKAFCTVVIRREDGEQWPYVPQDSLGHKLSVSSTGLNKIRWLYPINGIPESSVIKDTQPVSISCQARDLVEQRLEVTLTGAPPGSAHSSNMSLRAKTPKDKQMAIPQGVVVGNTLATADEFSFDLVYPNKDTEELLNSSVSLGIIRHHRDPSSGLVTLIFSVKFFPIKEMDLQVQLHVKAATGGLWRFPLRFTASEAPVDDIITVEATGMGKLSSVGFNLTSQHMQPSPFNAFFESGSDPEFTVSPQSGELLPVDTPGTHFVINFLPNVYGKQYYAKLIVQTPDMQWSYSIKGVLPEYRPPRGISAPPISGPHPVLKKQHSKKNYIRENLKLIATAVSSPVKGAPLTKRGWQQKELISI